MRKLYKPFFLQDTKYWVWFIIVHLILVVFSHSIYSQKDTIHYHDTLVLEPRHFKVDSEMPDSFNLATHGQGLAAYITFEIVSEGKYYLDSAVINIFAIMHCDKSWLSSYYQSNTQVISHELYHFKIAEIYAREYRKIMSKTIFYKGLHTEEMDRIEKYILSECNSFSDKYDSATNYSGNHNKQQHKWQKIIDRKLFRLQNYSYPKIKIIYLPLSPRLAHSLLSSKKIKKYNRW